MKPTIYLALLGAACAGNQAMAQQLDQPIQANDFVQLFETLNGPQPGHRKAHARGVCAEGLFMPTQSDDFGGAPLLASGDLPVEIRFSIGGGNPQADERTPGVRGMGMRIALPENRYHIFTGNNFPVLAGKTPEVFFGFLSTLLPDADGQRDPAKTMAYIQEHPSVQANAVWRQGVKTAASYANSEYFGLHTFHYQAGSTEQTRFRWQLIPDLGTETLSAEQAAEKPVAFLQDALAEQLKQGDVTFTLQAEIGEAGDSDTDPSVQWPQDRRKVTLGTVHLNTVGGDACSQTNFDPTMLSTGFTPSDDPFLKMRSTAYAISFGKRLSGQ